MDGHSVRSWKKFDRARDRRKVTIDMLPDNVLLQVFFYVTIYDWPGITRRHEWYTIVHVCPRWRYVVFSSPRRLNLRLQYEGHRPMLEVLYVWPVLPVTLTSDTDVRFNPPHTNQRWDNMVAALESEHYNRISEIQIFDMTNLRWERFAAAMQKPFPELTHLDVIMDHGDLVPAPALPDSFLGGSAPRLRRLWFRSIPFPSISKLLLSANGLVTLSLEDIPDSGYISPDAMTTALTVMTSLETLYLRFHSPRSRPDPASRPLSPSTRFVLPSLTGLTFEGVHEYLEDLLARTDAPLLHHLDTTFFMDLDFDLPQFHRLMGHAKEFKTSNDAVVWICDRSIQLCLYHRTREYNVHRQLHLQINCRELDWQLSSLAQVCSPSFPLISALEELRIGGSVPSSHWGGDMENAQWLELLDPFTALKNLYLTDEIALQFCSALLELSGERVTEVLPTLQNLFISPGYLPEGSQKAIKILIAARRHSGYPVSVHRGSQGRGWEDITKDLASED